MRVRLTVIAGALNADSRSSGSGVPRSAGPGEPSRVHVIGYVLASEMVDPTVPRPWMPPIAFASRCPRACPCNQQGLRPASVARSTLDDTMAEHATVVPPA